MGSGRAARGQEGVLHVNLLGAAFRCYVSSLLVWLFQVELWLRLCPLPDLTQLSCRCVPNRGHFALRYRNVCKPFVSCLLEPPLKPVIHVARPFTTSWAESSQTSRRCTSAEQYGFFFRERCRTSGQGVRGHDESANTHAHVLSA